LKTSRFEEIKKFFKIKLNDKNSFELFYFVQKNGIIIFIKYAKKKKEAYLVELKAKEKKVKHILVIFF
jgi:hypothetical protein